MKRPPAPGQRIAALYLTILFVIGILCPAYAATDTWLDNTDANWNTRLNRFDAGNSGPASGDSLLFGAAGSAGASLALGNAAAALFFLPSDDKRQEFRLSEENICRVMDEVPKLTTTAVGGKPYTAPAREIWAWGIGALASHLLIQTYGQAYNVFTLGFGLSPVLVSWCMMLPRILDGITDPFLGHLSDNTHTRWGRRKPYLLLGAVFGALFLSAIWWANPAWNEKVQFALSAGSLHPFYITYGIYTMAWSAVGYELTDDYNERSKVQAVGSFFLALVSLTAGWMYWLALRNGFHDGVIATVRSLFGAGFNSSKLSAILSRAFQDTVKGSSSEIWGMRWIAVGVGVLIILAAFVAAWVCRERFTHSNREHPPIGTAIKETFRNKPFVIIQTVYIFQTFAQRLGVVGFLIFIGTYYVCGGDKGLATKVIGLGTTIGTVLVFGLLPLMKPISKWIGKKAPCWPELQSCWSLR